jgi:hypothetical protein
MGRVIAGVRSLAFTFSLAILLALLLSQVASAQSSTIVRVEEDWELVVGEPDSDSDAPQITCVISPFSHLCGVYAIFELNHQSLPDYQAGGLQLQLWYGEYPLDSCNFPNSSLLSHSGEVIHWTQSIRLHDGKLVFEITNGSSTTWGAFGGQGYLKTCLPTLLTNLNSYDPAVSVDNSGAGYADNRIESLVLKRVRAYTSTGEEILDDTARVVHPRD